MVCIGSNQSFSQEIEEQGILDTINKNEIWLNFTPVVQVIIGAGAPYQSEFGLMYKRHLKGKYWLRAGGIVSPQQNYWDPTSYDVIVGDSLLITTSNERGGYHYAGFIGIEYRKTNSKITRFIGADLIYRQENTFRRIVEQDYFIDSIAAFPERHKYVRPMGDPEELYQERNQLMGGGVGVVAGLIFPLTEHFLLSAQVYMDFVFSVGERELIDRTTGVHIKNSGTTQFDFNQSLFQANLLFRF